MPHRWEDSMKRIKNLMIAVALAAAVAGGAPALAQSAPQVPLIETSQVRALVGIGARITIVDVRTPQEFAGGHIAGAILMPLDTLPGSFSRLPKTGKLIVYCRSGHRSAQAVQFLRSHGYANAVSMNGGFTAWSATQH
jgi:rhodanese-related sulfurtransferase